MQSSRAQAFAPVNATAVHPLDRERRLSRYPTPYQRRVIALANEHSRLGDVAFSFPGLLFALAAPRAGVDPLPAIRAILAGERLKQIAERAGVPMWLRALPPEAFAAPLPRLPDSPEFAKQIANHVPRATRNMPAWLDAIGQAFPIADEIHVLWIAREFANGPKLRERARGRRRRRAPPNYYTSVRRLCLWAWYSTNVPDAVPEGVRWSPAIELNSAEGTASGWLERFDLRLLMGDEPVADVWFEPATVDGFDFVPLRTVGDLWEEGEAMRNCVGGYANSVAENRSRIWSVRRNGMREATLELSQPFGDPLPAIYQLGGVQNEPVSRELSLAARHWMEANEHVLREGNWAESEARPNVKVWRNLWRPVWLAKQRIPDWLPLTPRPTSLWAI